MKSAYKSIFLGLSGAMMALTSCSPDDFPSINPALQPVAADYEDKIEISIDETTNTVTFKLNAPGAMPVWIIDGKTYSTTNGLQKIYASAGDYEIEVKIANAHGLSDGSFYKTFHVENTIFDYDKYLTFLSGGDGSRQWRFDNTAQGHLGCGESGTDGTNWWTAGVNEKASMGLYDHYMTFTTDYVYNYYTGDTPAIFCNKGVTRYEDYPNGADEDYNAYAEDSQSTFGFEVVGSDLYLTFPAGTAFPYMADNTLYDEPRYLVESMNAKQMVLVSDVPGVIAWHYIFTSAALGEEEEKPETPDVTWNENAPANIWRTGNIEDVNFWYAPGWNQIADPEYTINDYDMWVSLTEATTDQWQAQMAVITDLTTSADTYYDFKLVFNSNNDIAKVTVKLCQEDDDDNFIFTDNIALTAYEDCVFKSIKAEGKDISKLKLVLDFGGNPAGTEIQMTGIVLQEHEKDVEWDPTSSANLWNTASTSFTWWYAPGWSQIADPTLEVADNSYSFVLPSATTDRWQAQFAIETDIATSAENNYDFQVTINSSGSFTAMVKLTMVGNDDLYYEAATTDVALEAYEDVVVSCPNMPGLDISAIKLVFDFGGNPDNCEITISDIILQIH
ncbi:MAG: hypothetical protein LIP03_15280 [Bacteroidales bacterium]|nr:hypothetical protein [Bacteroidales bacterium]